HREPAHRLRRRPRHEGHPAFCGGQGRRHSRDRAQATGSALRTVLALRGRRRQDAAGDPVHRGNSRAPEIGSAPAVTSRPRTFRRYCFDAILVMPSPIVLMALLTALCSVPPATALSSPSAKGSPRAMASVSGLLSTCVGFLS